MNGIERIAAERKRQIEKEGFMAEHDNQWTERELALAAVCYTFWYALEPDMNDEEERSGLLGRINKLWPFDLSWWKPAPENRIRELEKAGALIAAEIDRMQRLRDKNEK
jgi:hypothetical protein